jgi:hypothetical protein
MQPHARLANLIEYSILAATTLKEIAQSAQVPYLLSAASLTLMILEFVSVRRVSPPARSMTRPNESSGIQGNKGADDPDD